MLMDLCAQDYATRKNAHAYTTLVECTGASNVVWTYIATSTFLSLELYRCCQSAALMSVRERIRSLRNIVPTTLVVQVQQSVRCVCLCVWTITFSYMTCAMVGATSNENFPHKNLLRIGAA